MTHGIDTDFLVAAEIVDHPYHRQADVLKSWATQIANFIEFVLRASIICSSFPFSGESRTDVSRWRGGMGRWRECRYPNRAAWAATWPANEVTKVLSPVMDESSVNFPVLAVLRGAAMTDAVV
jgi:hypothetical protein